MLKIYYLIIPLLMHNFMQCNRLPEIVLKKAQNLKIYDDSKETESIGYGEWHFDRDGELQVIQSFITEGDIVCDAGAHTGEWSELVLKHTNNNCILHSFEPVGTFYEKLLSKVENRAYCHKMALGKNETKQLMNYFFQENEECSTLYDRPDLNRTPVKKIMVPITFLDQFCSLHNITHINFLKIDVEGAEWDVIQGARNMIDNHNIDFIQFEYGSTFLDANITLEQIFHYLKSKNYELFRIAPDGLIHIPQWRKELENYHLSNYLAVDAN